MTLSRTVILGQDPPVDLDFQIYPGSFWKADIAWLDADGNPVSAAGRSMQLRIERTALDPTLVYPADLASTDGPAPDLNTADYLVLSDGRIEMAWTSETTAALRFSSTVYRIFLLTDGVPELWAKGRIGLVGR